MDFFNIIGPGSCQVFTRILKWLVIPGAMLLKFCFLIC
ncbi:hypothetical protein B4166_1246 [Caldibacillus thermoamylovorans]|uniref:Uncharacterized protein n=1 Tax=Caldibacillus thermoamylovorans TaxID=35841 RepID=A0ABD4A2J8_9BACI|nr:hypothetical protein B4166_1246 [Caldibacillus thermoamylovorans]KIO70846.1 hypothetical protein B4167_1253 [Caldibacillus thermoamylovorans]